jgi:hypothetical protein
LGGNELLHIDAPGRIYDLGDRAGNNGGTLLQMNGTTQLVRFLNVFSASIYMEIDPVAGNYQFGDVTNNLKLSVDVANQKIKFGTNADTLFTINANGSVRMNHYGAGTFPGVPAYTLQVDASGNIIEGAGGGGGWGTTGTVATLTGNANVELAGNTISITDTTVSFFTVDTTGGGNYFLGDLNNTNNGTYIQLADSFSGIFICTKVGAFTGASVVDIRPPNYKFGDVDISANGTRLFIDDSIQKISLISAGGTGVGGIQTNAPSAAGPGLWLLGRIIVGASVLDATQYIEAMVDSVLYKLALAQ